MSFLDQQTEMDASGIPADTSSTPFHVRALRALTAAMLFGIMALGFTDVLLRYFFHAPIEGADAIMGLMLGVLVFSSLPVISRSGGHITVELFDRLFRGRVDRTVRVLAGIFEVGAVAFIAERLWLYSLLTWRANQLHDLIDLPLWPFALVFAVLATLAGLVLIVRLWSIVVHTDAK